MKKSVLEKDAKSGNEKKTTKNCNNAKATITRKT